ncbi:MAG: hypothetical protein IPL65_02270 [Lewinellaceae bacterium]|nr:hypothetical protein [Lewinellaceae bacterium]
MVNKKFNLPAILSILLGLALLSACNRVYLEKPMPSEGEEIRNFPKTWYGVYKEQDASSDDISHPIDTAFAKCYRIEPIGQQQALVSAELRLHRSNLHVLEAKLENMLQSGEMGAYTLSDHFIRMKDIVVKDSVGMVHFESQFIRMHQENDWYVLDDTRAPMYLYDFGKKIAIDFETEHSAEMKNEFALNADTLSEKQQEMVAKKTGADVYYLNFKTWTKDCGHG